MLVDSKKDRRNQMAVNFIGLVSPLIAAFFAIPILFTHLGTEKFGLLTLFWAIIGYANIFELGLGRSITKMLSGKTDKIDSNSEIIFTALSICIAVSGIGMAAIWFGFPYLFKNIISLPPELFQDTLRSVKFLIYVFPLLIISPILVGILEAHHKFTIISLIRVPSGIALFAIPALLTTASDLVSTFILGMLIVRVVTTVFQAFAVYKIVTVNSKHLAFIPSQAKNLLTYGGWLTVSAIVGPMLVYFDRFFLAAARNLEETGIYTTPFEAVVRFLIIPAAVVGVMFPRFVANFLDDKINPKPLYYETHLYVFILVMPVFLCVMLFANDLLSYWLKTDQNIEEMALIARILVVAVVLNAAGHVSQGYIQAVGHANWTGKLHLFELVIYFLYMPRLIDEFGANGAAFGWLIRVIISTLFLFLLAHRLLIKNETQGQKND